MSCISPIVFFFILRVQGVSNLIQWTYSSGDPSSVDIIVNNANNQTLNGNFSIARNVPVSQEVWFTLLLLSQYPDQLS